MYDLIIIGAGPAGMTAGIYASRRAMKTLIIGKEPGGQLIWASEIENYPGFMNIKNYELISKMKEQVEALGVEIKTDEVKQIEVREDDKYKAEGLDKYFLLTVGKDVYEAKAVIIAMGLSPRRLAIEGELEFSGKGVSYCANCDGPFFRGKKVAVVGGGNSALDAAEVLSKLCSHVYLIHRSESFKAFDELVNEVKSKENIEIIMNSEIRKISGENKVQSIKVADSKAQEERNIEVDGVFIEVGRIASTDLVGDLVKRDGQSQIIVDEKCRTSHEGIFAAGDVTQGEFKQITIACGQATIAALAAYQYLQMKKGGVVAVMDRGHKNNK
jgi:thioredoxin-disulfide reductase